MAMAFAPVGIVQEIIIHEPDVVAKSYPSFWNHMRQVLNITQL
jgi:3-phosphoshikimate 1-carboxyvinyltransferase